MPNRPLQNPFPVPNQPPPNYPPPNNRNNNNQNYFQPYDQDDEYEQYADGAGAEEDGWEPEEENIGFEEPRYEVPPGRQYPIHRPPPVFRNQPDYHPGNQQFRGYGGRQGPPLPPRNQDHMFRGGVPFIGDRGQFQNAPIRGVESHFRPTIDMNASPIVSRGTFEVRPQYLAILPHFYGKSTEQPYLHLSEFTAICGTITGNHRFTQEDVKLNLFQFTLKDRAKQWFLTLPPRSIDNWDDMQQVFLDEYYTTVRTSDARNAIRTFQQQSGEPFHESFTRFKELLRTCPHHDITLWELIKAFSDGLSSEDSRDLYSISGGSFLSNPEQMDWEYLERNAKNSKKREQSDRRSRCASVKSVDYEVNSRLEEMEKKLAGLGKAEGSGRRHVSQVSQEYPVCDGCNDIGHTINECPMSGKKVEEVKQFHDQGARKPYDPNSNTYHPGSRNHPNFSYGNPDNQSNPNFVGSSNFQGSNQQSGNQPFPNRNQGNNQGGFQRNQNGYQQGRPSAMDEMRTQMGEMMGMLKTSIQSNEVRDKAYESLSKQVGQLAEQVGQLARNPGKLPSDTTLNPEHKGMSSKNIHIGHLSTIPIKIFDNVEVVCEVDVKSVGVGENNNKPTFTEKMEFSKSEGVETNTTPKFSNSVKMNLPPKLHDPGEPFIEIKIGSFETKRAILDFGADASVLPSSLYDPNIFGKIKDLDATVVLGNVSCKQPRGILTDVIVEVGEFRYITDFILLDDSGNPGKRDPVVILGRPFLATTNAIIDCKNGLVDLKCGKEVLRLMLYDSALDDNADVTNRICATKLFENFNRSENKHPTGVDGWHNIRWNDGASEVAGSESKKEDVRFHKKYDPG